MPLSTRVYLKFCVVVTVFWIGYRIGKHSIVDSSVLGPTPKKTAPTNQNPSGPCNVFDISKTSSDTSRCITTKSQPPFIICIHPVDKDVWVSAALDKGELWEPDILMPFQRLLQQDPELGVIDIGANIGFYALLAARMNRSVVAVEARLLHVQMMHHAIVLNQLQEHDIQLLHNAVSDTHDVLSLLLTETRNQGHTQVGRRGKGYGIPREENSDVRAIYMDDLLPLMHFRKAIIKMDIEGSEHKAIAHCDKLLDAVYVPFIFMEWSMQNEDNLKNRAAQNNIQEVLTRHKYSAYSTEGVVLITTSMDTWPVNIIWKHKDAHFGN